MAGVNIRVKEVKHGSFCPSSILNTAHKYGSYSVIELSCNKVLDYKLVQVRTVIKKNITVSLIDTDQQVD